MWTDRTCEREAEVRKLARSKTDTPEPRGHIAECVECRETLAVARWMQELSDVPFDAPPRLNPEYLWWKAQILRRWEAERAVARPIEIGERVQVGIGLVGALVLLVWIWRELQPQAATFGLLLAMGLSGVVIAITAIIAFVSLFRDSDTVAALGSER